MKYLSILFLVLVSVILASAQSTGQSKLTGTVYDANGAVVGGAKVSAIDGKGQKLETVTNQDGVFVLELAFSRYDTNSVKKFKEAKYDIVVSSPGFNTSVTKGFVFVPAYGGKMQLDVALEVGPCNDCELMTEYPAREIETSIPVVFDKITPRPVVDVPCKPEKVTKKPTPWP